MKQFSTKVLSILALSLVLLVSACRQEEPAITINTNTYSGKIATQWFEKFRDLTKKSPGFTPPVAARAFGYAGVTLYESVVPGMTLYQSLEEQLSDLHNLPKPSVNEAYNWAIVANAAMRVAADSYYANMPDSLKAGVSSLEAQLFEEYKGKDADAVLERSKQFGVAIATAIFDWSKTDGAHEGYSKNFPASYIAPEGFGFWKPTLPAFKPAMQPYWGNNRTFIPNCATNTQPNAPMLFSTQTASPFYAQALTVYAIGTNLTPAQKTIAQFWSDDPGAPGTPPGHSISIATQVLNRENADLALAAETYSKVGIALSDAFISCWRCKFQYNLMRPVTFIRENIDSTWTPTLATPPFPEFTSGHSVQTAAACEVLGDLFGYNYVFTDRTHENRTDIDGHPRSYNSFAEIADEAAISRLFGGIHFQEGIEAGKTQGRRVGQEVSNLRFRP